MADQTQETGKAKVQADFEALPLDEKIATLFRMEVATLSETFNYAIESPLKVVEKVGDIITEFGEKIEASAKNAQEKAEKKKKTAGEKTSKTPSPKQPDGAA